MARVNRYYEARVQTDVHGTQLPTSSQRYEYLLHNQFAVSDWRLQLAECVSSAVTVTRGQAGARDKRYALYAGS